MGIFTGPTPRALAALFLAATLLPAPFAAAQDPTENVHLKALMLLEALQQVARPENAGRPLSAEQKDSLRRVEDQAEALYRQARDEGDVAAQAEARQLLGLAYLLGGHESQAVSTLGQSADLYRRAGDDATAAKLDAAVADAKAKLGAAP